MGGESVDDPTVAAAYRAVFDAARRRRDDGDAAFVALLPGWVAHASAAVPGALLVEQVLEEVAVPLLTHGPAPLVVVVDGMSAAVAAELGEQLAERAWVEVSRETGHRSEPSRRCPRSPARAGPAC